jgi:hypothetical protein
MRLYITILKLGSNGELRANILYLLVNVVSRNRIELKGAYAQDIVPVLALPSLWLEHNTPSYSSTFHTIRLPTLFYKWNMYLPDNHTWIQIYENILIFSYRVSPKTTLLNAHYSSKSFQEIWLHNIALRLLTLRPLVRGNNRENMIEEACRLASLIYLDLIRRRLEQYPARITLLVKKLRLSLLPTSDWVELWPLRLWCLYIGAMEARQTDDLEWFVAQLASDSGNIGIRDWNGIRECVMQILWIEDVFRGLDDHLLMLNLDTYRSSAAVA